MAVHSIKFGAATAVAVMLVSGLMSGCASSEKPQSVEQSPDSSGFTWVGQGEPTNFATDQGFCARGTGINSFPGAQFSTGDAGVNPYATSRRNSARNDYATKRQYWQCMESRGWQLVGGR